MSTTATTPEIQLEPLKRLRKDLSVAAKTLSHAEARYLVDLYYQVQGLRIVSENQIRSQTDTKEPHAVLSWFSNNTEMLENSIKRALDVYSDQNPVGRWSKSITGIGPVIAAGLLAHLYPLLQPSENYPNSFTTLGKIERFAGLDPTQKWVGREDAGKLVEELLLTHEIEGVWEDLIPAVAAKINRDPNVLKRQALWSPKGDRTEVTKDSLVKAIARRPWNAQLKVLCWKIGESFVKVQNNEKDFYGKIYAKRKLLEQTRNERGDFKGQAEDILKKKKIGKSTEAYKWLQKGMLSPAHIHARARRRAIKIYLSHWHSIAYEVANGVKPPAPYAIAIMGHADYIPAPNWPLSE